jgi:ankyrin repeat protein
VDILRALLEAGADPHATREIYADGNVHTVSALELAASRDLHEAVSLLLRTGKLAPHAPLDGLRAAMIRGQAPLVRTFLAEGVRFESPLVDAASRGPNSPFPVNQTPSLPGEILDALGAAALLGHHEAIRALLPLCGDLDRANRWSRTALWMAVRAGELPAVELLLAAGASPHVPSWHDTPLQEAARLGDPRILAALRGSSPGTRRL